MNLESEVNPSSAAPLDPKNRTRPPSGKLVDLGFGLYLKAWPIQGQPALQAESQPVWFRNIRIRNLDR